MIANIQQIANSADMIVNGYAFVKKSKAVSVLNLHKPEKATMLSLEGEVLETSMDDIEISIVCDYFKRNKQHLED